MAAIRKVGLIAVGVDKTNVLQTLKGAASGAGKLAQWLQDQQPFGVTPVVKLLVDAANKVSARDVQDAARAMVAAGDLDALILYFAGHGIVKAGFDEQVLLSDVGTYKDEAIAITPTALNARYSGVAHVIIISDSCRSAIDPFGPLGTVVGKPVLERGAVVGAHRSKVDVFYATEPSQTAKEFNGEGFFTDVLLDVLTHPTPGVCESWADLPPGVVVIPAWKLESYLDTEVPLRAAQQKPAFDQSPDFTVTSREPLFFGYAKSPPPNAPAAAAPEPYVPTEPGGPPAAPPPYGGGPVSEEILDVPLRARTIAISEVASIVKAPWGGFLPGARITEDAGLSEAIKDYVGSDQGRQAFETRTGYSIIGDEIERAFLSGGAAGELALTDEGNIGRDLRLYPEPFSVPGQEGTVAVCLKSGSICFLPIMPGYIGTLHVRDGQAVSLSFEISAQLQQPWVTEEQRRRLAHRRALAASLATSGKLGRLAKAEGDRHGTFLREDKLADPTLGIYASYAYALSGNDEDARSVYDWFIHHPSLDPPGLRAAPTPFDVAMLAGASIQGTAKNPPAIAPFCPMMSLGWSVLSSYLDTESLHGAIVQAGRFRLNCEWTTFRQRDVKPLIAAFQSGEIK
jgi:Caspase domain